jgi:DNA-binding transcriptional ArsR family regulator
MVKYLLISLEDEKIKALSEVLGNSTCKKIIDLLSEQELSETDISKKLKIPMNTAEYNLKKLIKSGLVEQKKEFFWSVKGKKIIQYRLSNKDILISSKKSKYDSVKRFVPVVLISGLGALLIGHLSSQTLINSAVGATKASPAPLMLGAERMAEDSGVANLSVNHLTSIFNLNPAIWFFTGVLFALIVLLITNYTIKKIDERG